MDVGKREHRRGEPFSQLHVKGTCHHHLLHFSNYWLFNSFAHILTISAFSFSQQFFYELLFQIYLLTFTLQKSSCCLLIFLLLLLYLCNIIILVWQYLTGCFHHMYDLFLGEVGWVQKILSYSREVIKFTQVFTKSYTVLLFTCRYLKYLYTIMGHEDRIELFFQSGNLVVSTLYFIADAFPIYSHADSAYTKFPYIWLSVWCSLQHCIDICVCYYLQ